VPLAASPSDPKARAAQFLFFILHSFAGLFIALKTTVKNHAEMRASVALQNKALSDRIARYRMLKDHLTVG